MASSQSSSYQEITLGYLLARLWSAKIAVAFFVILVTGLVYLFTQIATPKYSSEAQVLIEEQETPFTRPEVERNDIAQGIDERDVASEVQVLLSRDVSDKVIDQLGLRDDPRFDPALQGFSPIKSLLVLAGLSQDPMRLSPEERVYQTFAEQLSVFNIPESRVIVVRYRSEDPVLSANIANALVSTYQSAQRETQASNTRSASSFLENEIADLRQEVSAAEAAVARYRAGSGLFMGANETSISTQQLSETATELTRARADESEARSRAEEIRALISQQGTQVALPDSFSTPLTQRLQEEQATVRGRIAELSATLLPQHPRLRELTAQLNDVGGQIRSEASRIAQRFDNEARVAAARASALEDELARQSAEASRIAEAEVELRALEREASAQRDLLASYLTRFREAATREDAALLPTNARLIQTAQIVREPVFPRTLPMVAIAFAGSFAMALFGVMSHAILAGAVREEPFETYDDRREHDNGAPPQPAMPRHHQGYADTGYAQTASPMAMPEPVYQPPATNPAIARLQAMSAAQAQAQLQAQQQALAQQRVQAAPEPVQPPQPVLPTVRTYTLSDADECRRLFSHLRRTAQNGGGTRVTVGAADPQAIAGDVALKMARALADAGRSVVLLDCVGDLKASGISADGPGFYELVTGANGFDEALHKDPESPLHFVPAGFKQAAQSMIADDAADLVFSALAETYDTVVVNAGPDPQLLLECAGINDAMVLCGDPQRINALGQTLSSIVTRERLLAVRMNAAVQPGVAISA